MLFFCDKYFCMIAPLPALYLGSDANIALSSKTSEERGTKPIFLSLL